MKNLVKDWIKKEKLSGTYLKTKFPHLSDTKIKEAIFVWPQIRELFKDGIFTILIERKEKAAGEALKNVVHNFLGYQKA